MTAGWGKAPLGTVCKLFNGRAYKKQELLAAGPTPVLRVGNFFTNRNWYYSNLKLDQKNYCDNGDLLYAWSASFGPRIWDGGRVIYHYHIWKMEPDERRLNKRYLYYFLDWDKEQIKASQGAGATMIHVTKGAMEAREISLPPLEEQLRIVAVLDNAFAAIATATANAERNLANAEDLFASELDALVLEAQSRFQIGTLVDQCERVTVGHVGPMKDRYQSEGIPFLRSQNVRPFEISFDGMMFIDEQFDVELKKSRLRPGDVAVVRTGYPGTAAVIPSTLPTANCSDLVVIRPGRLLNPHFLAAFLNSNIGKRAVAGELVGAAQKHFNVGSAKKVLLPLPPLADQQNLVDRAMVFSLEARHLVELTRSRLRHLRDLKSALLRSAFAGELAVGKRAASVIQTSSDNDNDFSAPAFTANVLAFAYRRHVAHGNENTFGRVKAQKVLQLCESVGAVDLGRRPIKDAAGPNDFRHMLAAEEWAKANGFFEFEKRTSGGGYIFKPLARFDEMYSRALLTIRPVQEPLERSVALIVHMKTEQAELLATVHAAWNNLILDGAEISDAAIIYEARENWHPDKVRFSDSKFHEAIRAIRSKRIMPDGSAKRVVGQERLI